MTEKKQGLGPVQNKELEMRSQAGLLGLVVILLVKDGLREIICLMAKGKTVTCPFQLQLLAEVVSLL